jgi:putative ABC transport system permease protein
MKTVDIFGYSFSAIKLRKLRAALTILGVVIGIAAIVALLSITQGLQVTITTQLQKGLSTNTLIVTPGQSALSEVTSGSGKGGGGAGAQSVDGPARPGVCGGLGGTDSADPDAGRARRKVQR